MQRLFLAERVSMHAMLLARPEWGLYFVEERQKGDAGQYRACEKYGSAVQDIKCNGCCITWWHGWVMDGVWVGNG